ncbi:DUF4340 domain-containing protein [Spirulina sp. 06S082]|uniref:DUF4340 domain-containing protein n=1 Tax=Spirulina sp. 06S082 TaxID=3110248 RepID=UPI002B202BDD|nr:DUF4340 domain-containing protein [Spirulina sp. 06S082]MEA5467836.1 DUF4340 domain-containing protein [Spirulina sp. 06S082]
MKLQKTTWALVITALFLTTFVYLYEVVGKSQQEVQAAKQRKIFDFTKEDIQGFTIEREKEKLVFKRVEKETTSWQILEPEESPANDPAVSFLLELLAEGERDRLILARSEELEEYGLSKPLVTVAIAIENRSQPYILELGKENFDRKFIYARVNPDKNEKKSIEIILIPIDFKYAVERELEEWKAKKKDE